MGGPNSVAGGMPQSDLPGVKAALDVLAEKGIDENDVAINRGVGGDDTTITCPGVIEGKDVIVASVPTTSKASTGFTINSKNLRAVSDAEEPGIESPGVASVSGRANKYLNVSASAILMIVAMETMGEQAKINLENIDVMMKTMDMMKNLSLQIANHILKSATYSASMATMEGVSQLVSAGVSVVSVAHSIKMKVGGSSATANAKEAKGNRINAEKNLKVQEKLIKEPDPKKIEVVKTLTSAEDQAAMVRPGEDGGVGVDIGKSGLPAAADPADGQRTEGGFVPAKDEAGVEIAGVQVHEVKTKNAEGDTTTTHEYKVDTATMSSERQQAVPGVNKDFGYSIKEDALPAEWGSKATKGVDYIRVEKTIDGKQANQIRIRNPSKLTKPAQEKLLGEPKRGLSEARAEEVRTSQVVATECQTFNQQVMGLQHLAGAMSSFFKAYAEKAKGVEDSERAKLEQGIMPIIQQALQLITADYKNISDMVGQLAGMVGQASRAHLAMVKGAMGQQ